MENRKKIMYLYMAAVLLLGGCSSGGGNSETSAPGDQGAAVTPQQDQEPAEIPEASLPAESDRIPETIPAQLLYQGHSSLRITTAEGKVIYVDPYAGEGYDVPADLILVTHQHGDHNQMELISGRNPDCTIITEKEALAEGEYKSFELGFVKVETVEAGNARHDPAQCVGYILTFADGVTLYISGDTDKTATMESLSARELDYALFCCDGEFNMDTAAASECARLVGARVSIPYHTAPSMLFSRDVAEQFSTDGRLIIEPAEVLELRTGE